jgi:predicted transposase YbfD/YdcC
MGLKQGFEITRERTAKGQTTVEVDYGITSLGPDEADAARLLDLVRGHWRIENELHYVRDVTLGEDACRVRTGNAPQVLAALRNTVIHLLRDVPADSRPAAIEQLNVTPDRALELIGIPPIQ